MFIDHLLIQEEVNLVSNMFFISLLKKTLNNIRGEL